MKNNQVTSAKRRIMAMLMVVAMLVTMFTGSITVSAEQSTQNSNQGDGVIITKTAVPKNDGTVDITIDAYTTGTVVSSSKVTPMDILLVLDVSGSMDKDIDGDDTYNTNNKKITLLKNAVNDFIEQTQASTANAADGEKHRMAIVKYADDSYIKTNNRQESNIDNVSDTKEGNDTFRSGFNDYNYTQLVKNFTVVNDNNAEILRDAVNDLEAGGATSVDYGLRLAQEVMNKRDDKTRKVAVIVFSDGEPNHSNGWDGDVANTALSKAKSLKDPAYGHTVYTISIFKGTNSSVLEPSGASSAVKNTNKFMHYLSSNYPNATSMTNAGTGSPANGYYMTVSTEEGLEEIFKTISSSIGKPEMTLGADTVVADSLSPCFEFSKDLALESITLQTLDKTADGWAEAETANGVTAVIGGEKSSNKTVTVSGFSFDENYVTDTPKPNTTDDYGKKLRIIINVKPDYTAIDAMSPKTAEVATNSEIGPASIISGGNIVATTTSPTVALRKITYKVTVGDETKPYNDGKSDVYRLTGSDYTVIKAPTLEGYSFYGWKKDGAEATTFKMPNGDVEITGIFTPNEYDVKYVYDGSVPKGADPVTADSYSHKGIYGETYSVKPQPTAPAGYKFTGWRTENADITNDNKFTMPANNVTFIGSFSAEDVGYKAEHYLQDTEGNYPKEATYIENLSGLTGNNVSETAHDYIGFTFDSGYEGNITSGTVKGDGSLVLKLYYKRDKHRVSYKYAGGVEFENMPELPVGKDYYYEEAATVAAEPAVPGYTFSGWSTSAEIEIDDQGNFVMGHDDVEFIGYFEVNNNTPYEIQHFRQSLDGSYEKTPYRKYNSVGTTGETVSSNPIEIQGFTYNPTADGALASAEILGDGSLILKFFYDRNEYKVTYEYFNDVLEGNRPDLSGYGGKYKYGETVNVKDKLYKEGYTFNGWVLGTGGNVTGSFTMPNNDVVIKGWFNPNTNTPYQVNYYFEAIDSEEYELSKTESHPGAGTTGNLAEEKHDDDATKYPGFTFNAEKSKTSGTIAADGSLVLELYYDRNEYAVRYRLTEDPSFDVTVPDIVKYKYGKTVKIQPKLTEEGYTFVGWTTSDVTFNINTNDFTMPYKDVELRGYFTPNEGTEYKIEYYLQSVDGEYLDLDADASDKTLIDDSARKYVDNLKGTTGDTVKVTIELPAGFEHDEEHENELLEGVITGDGGLVLRIYYKRIQYDVSYAYIGALIPDEAPSLNGMSNSYPFGATVNIKDDILVDGYDFIGWTTPGGAVHEDDTSFVMPNQDVELQGRFTARDDTEYKVYHIGQDLNGGYTVTLSDPETRTGVTGGKAAAEAKSFDGFTYNNDKTASEGQIGQLIKADGSTEVKLYYDRNARNVRYAYANKVTGASALPVGASAVYGSAVTVAEAASAPGYDFGGWVTDDADITEGKFTMPDTDVVLVGTFIPRNDTKYTVKHMGQDSEGDGYNQLLKEEEMQDGKTGDTKSAKPISIAGYTYNSEKSKDTATKVITGDGKTVLILYYDRDIHRVTYTYTGTEIKDAPSLPLEESYRYGATVYVEADPSVKGYDFVGWTSLYETVKANDASFTMPAMDVQLRGEFKARTDITYRVEHYVQDKTVPGNYNHLKAKDQTFTGTMNTQVIGYPITITGYAFNAEKSADTGKGIVDVDDVTGAGTTVLKLYYDRVEHNVAYEYIGTVPYGATPGSELATEQYIEGEAVTVKTIVVPDGYTFSGWESDGGTVNPGNPEAYPTFAMPNRDVHLVGSFAPKDTSYKVEHYFQINGGSDYSDNNYASKPELTEIINKVTVSGEPTRSIKVGETVVAHPKAYAGFTYDGTKSAASYSGVVGYDGGVSGAGLTLKLYYNKNPHTVYYRYSRMPRNITAEQETAMNEKLPEEQTQYAGEGVEIGDAPTDLPAGYSFGGWLSTISGGEITDGDGVDFTMPDKNVVLIARLTANNDTPYKVEHYIGAGDTAERYTLYNTETLTGTTDTSVQAKAIEVGGYTYYAEHPSAISEAYIKGDGSTVLKLYYRQNPSGGGGNAYGKIEIKKTVNAPEDLDTENIEFTFNIYKGSKHTGTVYNTVTVKANDSQTVRVPVGTYYITEADGNITGYTLSTVCSNEENTVEVTSNKTVEIAFENTYKSKEDMLEKNDHFAYIIGYPDGNVKPNAGITRAEVATIFFRMMTDEARAAYIKTENAFSDVSKSDWHNIAISTLENAQILNGYLDGTFRPDEAITRAELSKIAASFYKAQLNDSVKFNDISGHWAEDLIKSAYGYGFIDGYPDGSFKPDQAITRAETMKIVNRSLGRTPHKDYMLDDMIKWSDNSDKNVWYYADVQEATNSHNYKMSAGYEVWTELRAVRDWAALENADNYRR